MSNNPYKKNICWHGVKVKVRGSYQKGSFRPCGLDARKYKVERKMMNGAQGIYMECYYCFDHKKTMEESGFILTLIE